ncbi:methylase involved in ubiquinone/menaquinone biosynthesis [Beggiatoa alba B18LD]|uniref:Methylase involved in ubiquinone/menaquinone biosynthesis n=1 Tax=Beggiatoa alba B18LD TaxID=395493 RepID=I3CF18_9GAMM|nr:class I SAM-dependent methyltransferase [Beggiatoa alba]EIJ42211.1 methylase involved in ubiquinone/menaquinone biosynthesis [Beggiatoa alba B18LD]
MTTRFDTEAKTWDRGRRVEVAMTFANCIKAHVPLNATQRLLDYGCGTGLVAYQFIQEVAQITGMDSSEKMLESFLEKAESYPVKAVKHDMMQNDLPAAVFEVVVSSMAMHHIQDTARFFQQVQQTLTTGGYFAVADLDKEDGTFHDKGNEGVWHFGFERQAMCELLVQSGFQLVHFEYFFHIEKNNKHYQIFAAIAQKVA